MAGVSAERQETGLVEIIVDAVNKNEGNPITVISNDEKIENVIGAEKYKGRQQGGSEPYTDVVIYVTNRGKKEEVNLSCKGTSAPSLAGGGLRGLELAVPGITRKFMKAVYSFLLRKNIKSGDKVPDTFGKIRDADKIKIVVGNKAMGGPIHFMYMGPMNVFGLYDQKKNEVTLNGSLHEAKKYAKTHKLYFRLRARREDQRFDPNAKESDGTPKIYGKSPSRGDSAGRIVVVDKVPSKGLVVNI